MNIEIKRKAVQINDVMELGGGSADLFRDTALAALDGAPGPVDVDLSKTSFVDSCGLGALLSVQRVCATHHRNVRLINPTPPVRQILELTRMHHVFEIVQA